MSDEELFMLLLLCGHLLEQHRQRTLQRMLAFASTFVAMRSLEMQRAAIQFFVNAYQNRRAWVFHRQFNEFDVYYDADLNTSKDLDPNYWIAHYRMGRETFEYVCRNVYDYIVKEELNMRETIPVPKRVGIAIWWLANGGSYRSVGQTFGVSPSIVGRITKDFVGALVHLRNEFISWPQTQEQCIRSVDTFKDLSPLPNLFGAIDGTHIEIMAPENSTVDFFDRKQRYSLGCQGICDGKLKFLSMSAGFPGSVHDSRILRNTWIFQTANEGNIMQTPVFQLNALNSIKPFLVGDAAYPLTDWLIKPFQHSNNMEHHQRAFNLALSQARVCIERAFGSLKGRWRILLGKVCLEPSYAADVVMACSVLHNICQERNEPTAEVIDPYNDHEDANTNQHNREICGSGEEIRNLLLDYILEHENSFY